MLKKCFFLGLMSILLGSCTDEGEICECWKELVTKEGDRTMSDGCEYILEMSHEEISEEAGPECVEEINKLLFNEEVIEFEEEIDENALQEQGEY